MSDFKKWLRQAYREPHTRFTEHNMEVAYLAGQASAETRVDNLIVEVDNLKAKCAEIERELKMTDEFRIKALNDLAELKAQAGEPIYQIKTEYEWVDCPKSHYDARASHQRRIVYLNPTTERPYNPLNDYAVIPMNPTDQVKAQAGEPVAWQHRQRGLKEYEWQEWQTVGYKPQGPESQTFQMRPLFTHPTTERRVPPQVIYDTQTGEIKPLVSQERIEELERELEFAKLILAERGLLGLMTP